MLPGAAHSIGELDADLAILARDRRTTIILLRTSVSALEVVGVCRVLLADEGIEHGLGHLLFLVNAAPAVLAGAVRYDHVLLEVT